MSGVNKVIIVGNLGNDPELRSFPDGSQVANISVATSDSWTDKQTGEKKERTEWHRIILRDRGNYRMAQLAGQYLRKGSKVYIEGKLQTRKYNDAQGIERYVTEIIADTLQFLDSRQAEPQQAPVQQPQAACQQAPVQQTQQNAGGYAPAHGQQQMSTQQQADQAWTQAPQNASFHDDIPF